MLYLYTIFACTLSSSCSSYWLFEDAADLVKAIELHRESDVKLKGEYQNLVQAYKEQNAVSSNLAATINALAAARLTTQARSELTAQKKKLEAELKTKKATVDKLEPGFKENQKKLMESTKENLTPILKNMSSELDKKSIDSVLSIFDLFVLGDYKELPTLALGNSFMDHDAWREAGKLLAKGGVKNLPELKKAITSGPMSKRYAIAAALAEMGNEVDKADKFVYDEVYKLRIQLKSMNMDLTEKENRLNFLKKSLDAIRPEKK